MYSLDAIVVVGAKVVVTSGCCVVFAGSGTGPGFCVVVIGTGVVLAVVKLLIAFVVLGVLVVVTLLVAIVPVVMLCVVAGAWVVDGFTHSLSVHGFFKPHFGDGMPVSKRKIARL